MGDGPAMKRKRVVLLARAGAARERTQAAIVDTGGDVVAYLDPGETDEDAGAPPIPAC